MAAKPFQTAQNERSFSGLIDDVVLSSGRAQNLRSIVQYANLTIRECQAFGLFARDRIEEQVMATASPHIWNRPAYFRSVGAVRYGNGGYPRLKLPGRQQINVPEYFYAADDYYVFNGVSAGETISFLNYYWAKPLLYQKALGVNDGAFPGAPYSVRSAYFDILQDKWQYLNADGDGYVDTTGDADTDAARQKNSSHWFLENWYDMIADGTKAKVFARFDDTDKSNRAYAQYKASQNLLRNTQGFESEASTFDG